jgi:tetratricopeptide (TPR) repeat protein
VGNIYSADVFYEKSQLYLAKGDVEVASILADSAIKNNEFEPNYYRGRAKIHIVGAVSANGILSDTEKEKVLADLRKAVSLNPNNLVTLRNVIPLYYFLAEIDGKYLPVTRDYFRQVKYRFSNDAGVVVSIAKYEKKLGLTEDFNESVEIIKKLRPDLLNWHESFR